MKNKARKSVGTIYDISYFEPYEWRKKDKIYYYKICKICFEEVELGFSEIHPSAPYVQAFPHQCQKKLLSRMGVMESDVIDFLEERMDFEPIKPEPEWGQFFFVPTPFYQKGIPEMLKEQEND